MKHNQKVTKQGGERIKKDGNDILSAPIKNP